MRKLSARAVFGLGIFYDVLAAFPYYVFTKTSFTSSTYKVLGLVLMLCILFGLVGTFIGSVMWARAASNQAVLAAVMGIILSTLIYGNRVRFGFDDPRVMVIPFAGLVAFLLIIGR